MTTPTIELYRKLLAVQTTLHAPKNQFNDYGGFHYRSCEDILIAAKPLLAEQGLTLILSDEVVNIGAHNYVQATATLLDENGGEMLRATAYAREAFEKKGMDSSQMTGTASSYARKYALNGLFLIDDTKDADTNEATAARQQEPPPQRQQQAPPSDDVPPWEQQYQSAPPQQQPRQQRRPQQQQGQRQFRKMEIGEGGPGSATDPQKSTIHKMAAKAQVNVESLLYDETFNAQTQTSEPWDQLSKGTASHLIDMLKRILDGEG